jgi:chromosome segregation ATPase
MQREMDRKLEGFKRQYEACRKEADCARIQSLEAELLAKSKDLATYNAELKRLREQIETLARDKKSLESLMNDKQTMEERYLEEIHNLKAKKGDSCSGICNNGTGQVPTLPTISLTIRPRK